MRGTRKPKTIQAVWHYTEPKSPAEEVAGFFAFWRGVQVGPGWKI